MDDDAFLINAALDDDLATAYAGAVDDKPCKSGCLGVLLLIAIVLWALL